MLLSLILNMVRTSRKTTQKNTLTAITANLKGFFSADDILSHEQVTRQDISRATVYRFLQEQVDSGNLQAYTCERRTVYSREKSHCHFICEDTGKVIHFTIDNIDFLKKKIPGNISSFQIEVKGSCK